MLNAFAFVYLPSHAMLDLHRKGAAARTAVPPEMPPFHLFGPCFVFARDLGRVKYRPIVRRKKKQT